MDFSKIPLKDMDAAMLTLAIQQATGYNTKVTKAIELAAYCHHGKTRANPTRDSKGKVYPGTSPYIEHPLRVALRLIRWDSNQYLYPQVICAAILHDVIEDHADKLAELYEKAEGIPVPVSNWGKELNALNYVRLEFGDCVGGLVAKMTNAINTENDRKARNIAYVAKVQREIKSYDVFLIKFSDFCDNALGLHHQEGNPKMVKRLAEKYIGLVPVFIAQFIEFKTQGIDFNPDLIRRLNEAGPYLEGYVNNA